MTDPFAIVSAVRREALPADQDDARDHQGQADQPRLVGPILQEEPAADGREGQHAARNDDPAMPGGRDRKPDQRRQDVGDASATHEEGRPAPADTRQPTPKNEWQQHQPGDREPQSAHIVGVHRRLDAEPRQYRPRPPNHRRDQPEADAGGKRSAVFFTHRRQSALHPLVAVRIYGVCRPDQRRESCMASMRRALNSARHSRESGNPCDVDWIPAFAGMTACRSWSSSGGMIVSYRETDDGPAY